MDLALTRWKVSDRKSVEDLYFGDELVARENVPTQEVMTIIGVDGENHDEDLSTIDLGSYTEDHRMILTPEKKKKRGGEDATLPETPTKSSSLASKSISESSMRRHSARFRCFLFLAFFLGMILLGSIGVLSLNLYHIRNEEQESSSASDFETEDTPQFDYSGVTGAPVSAAPTSSAPTEAPVPAPVVPATESPSRTATSAPTSATTSPPSMLRATIAPTNAGTTTEPTNGPTNGPTNRPTNGPTNRSTSSPTSRPTSSPSVSTESPTTAPATPQPTSTLDVLRQELIQAAPISTDALFDETSVQYLVLEWLVGDPSLETYSSARILQRFALGTTFWSLHNGDANLLDTTIALGWMTYGDECDWPLTRVSQLCDGSGNATAIFLENVGFVGTLPSEISLLPKLEFLFVNSNQIQGTLPSEIGQLSNLVRLQVPQNNFVGTLPTEIGGLTNLRILGIGRNAFEGSLPTELGLMTNLGTFESRRNDFTGTLPAEISNMASLEYMSVEYNNLSGEIPATLGSLGLLTSLRLKENAFTGSVPEEVCSIGGIGVSADCDEVDCDCCDDCCFGCTRPPAPTEPTVTATVATIATTPTPTPSPTLSPSTAESPSCSSIQVASACYDPGQEIDLVVKSCDPDSFDLIVMFEEGSDTSSFLDAVFWVRSCGEESCNGAFSNGFMVMENKEPQRLGLAPWPLATGDYRLYLLRVINTGVVETMATSPLFRIDAVC